MGRKGLFHDYLTKAGLAKLEGWAREGLTDEQIAKNIGIARGTLYVWQNNYPDIRDALKRGKEPVDFEVENKLLERALGFEFEEVETWIEEIDGKQKKRVKRTKRVALPDVTAQIFWLKNRKPDLWRDRREVQVDGDVSIEDRSETYQEYLKKLTGSITEDDETE